MDPKKEECLKKIISGVVMLALLGIAIYIGIIPIGGKTPKSQAPPEIKAFVKAHSEFGKIAGSRDLPNWASGQRKEITTSMGTFIFYLEKGKVSGVQMKKADGGLEKLY